MQKTLGVVLLFAPMAALAQNMIPAPDQLPQSDEPPAVSILDVPVGATPPRSSGPPHICMPPDGYIVHELVGPTIIEFKVTNQGTVRDPVLRQSSGDWSIDLASMTCVAGWLYTPAMTKGRPLEVSLRQSINWNTMVLRGEPPPADQAIAAEPIHLPGRNYRPSWCETWRHNSEKGVLLGFYVGVDGSVKSVSIIQSSGDAATDKDAIDCVSRRSYDPARQYGKAIEVRLTDWLYEPGHRGSYPGTYANP